MATSADYCAGGGTRVEVDRARKVRCPVCNRRLVSKEMYDAGCHDGFRVPRHKARETPEKKPRRKTRQARRAQSGKR